MSNNGTTLARTEPAAGELIRQAPDPSAFMPIMGIDDIMQRQAALARFKDQVLVPGTDYGVIPGTGGKDGKPPKPSLLKPGAEKLCTLFGLTVRFIIVEKIEDWDGSQHNGEPFFYYLYRCQLSRGSYLIAESDGSCNSWEVKYRWRNGERTCPSCGKAAIKKSKYDDGGFYCFNKIGGCGAKFAANDQTITKQETGRIANPDIADLVNTLQKMGQKRSLIGTTLIGVNASEFFTQDIEDFRQEESEPRQELQRQGNGQGQGQQQSGQRQPAGKPAGTRPASNGAATNGSSAPTSSDDDDYDARVAELEGREPTLPATDEEPRQPGVSRGHQPSDEMIKSKGFQMFMRAVSKAKLPWGSKAAIMAYEAAASITFKTTVIAEDIVEADWEASAAYVNDKALTWQI